MKMIFLLVGLLVFQLMLVECPAQNLSNHPLAADSVPYGLKPEEWNKMQEVWFRKNQHLKVMLPDGNLVDGQILHIYKDTAIFYTDRTSFINQYVAENEIVYLHQDSLYNNSNIQGYKPNLIRSGLFWGTTAGVAAGIGLYFAGGGWVSPAIIAVPILAGGGIGGLIDLKNRKKKSVPYFPDFNSEKTRERYVLFPDHLPVLPGTSEHLPCIAPASFTNADFDDLIKASPFLRSLFGKPLFSIAGHTGLTSIEKNHGNFIMNAGLSLAFRPLTRLKTGYRYNQVLALENTLIEYTDYNSDLFFHQHAGTIVSHTFFVKYVPLAANQFLTNRFEVSAGIGSSFNSLYNQSHIRHNESWEVLSDNEGTYRNVGLILMSDLDFYVSRDFSIYLSLNKTISKPLKPEDLTAAHPITNDDIFFETKEVYPDRFDIVFGLQFHFLRR